MNESPAPSRLWIVGVMVLAHALGWLALLFVLQVVVPGYDRQFRNFHLKVPSTTENVITLSRWVIEYNLLAVLGIGGLLVLDAGVLLLLRVPLGARKLSWLWFVLMLLLPLLAIVLAMWNLWSTNAKLYEGLYK